MRALGLVIALLGAQLAWSAWRDSGPRSSVVIHTIPEGAQVLRQVHQATLTAAGPSSAGLVTVRLGRTPGPLQIGLDDFRGRVTLIFELWGYHRLVHNFSPGWTPQPLWLRLQPRVPGLVPAVYLARDYPFFLAGLLGLAGVARSRLRRRRQAAADQAMLERLSRGEVHEGDQIHGYRVGRLLGRGGMGRVLAATRVDDPHGEELALKLLIGTPDAASRARFLSEIDVCRGLRHPGLVFVLDWGEMVGQLYLVMELVPGRSLQDQVRHTPPGWTQSLEWARELALVLQELHQRGLVHRDVKPANVMVLPSGRLKLMDFGVARRTAELTTGGAPVGTLGYAAPEQIQGQDVDWRADCYSLGVLLYFCASGGKLPFEGLPLKVLSLQSEGTAVPLLERNPEVSAAGAELVHRLLNPEPGGRGLTDPGSLATLLGELQSR